MIDPVLITRKFNLIVRDLNALIAYGQLSLEDYLLDPVNEVAAERYLERIIGRLIDVNFHIITELGHPPPKDYFDSFTTLGKLQVLPVEFSQKIASAAGLRNRIVHEYDELDEKKIHEALQEALQDIPQFIQHVNRFVQNLDSLSSE